MRCVIINKSNRKDTFKELWKHCKMNSGGGDIETIQVGVHAKEKNLNMHVHIGEKNKVHTSIRQAN